MLLRVYNIRPAHNKMDIPTYCRIGELIPSSFSGTAGECNPVRLLKRNGFCLNDEMCYSLAFGFTY